ncbi:MAG: hypothetical protein EBZ77_08200 [Chitinophagia bacterium]|nr:hypothetical protein [Chitinophagia bacterium]
MLGFIAYFFLGMSRHSLILMAIFIKYSVAAIKLTSMPHATATSFSCIITIIVGTVAPATNNIPFSEGK